MTDSLPPLTSAELADLKAKAKAATPGPWKTRFNGNVTAITKDGYALFRHVVTRLSAKYEQAVRDCDYASATNPETILRLIDMVEWRDAALNKIALAGENGLPPDYNSWLQFHERIAQMAREALAATEPPK